jgi:hypothetical protein
VNCTSATVSLPNIFYWALGRDFVQYHSVLNKKMSLSRLQVTVTEPMSSVRRVTLDKGSLFAECPLYSHSTNKLSVGPFTSSFAEHIRWHLAKALSLPSAQLTSTRQKSFIGQQAHNTRQRDHQQTLFRFLCQVTRPQHSAKKLYRCLGVPSFTRAMTLTLDKVILCRVLHSAKCHTRL